MTEEEARTKECCGPIGCGRVASPTFQGQYFADQPYAPSVPMAQISAPLEIRYCTGSACMAWRWVELGGFERLFNRDTPLVWVKSGNSTTDGYCGHAGKP